MEKVKRSKREWARRYASFVFIMFIVAFGISLSLRANLGSSSISAPPYVISLIPGMPLTMGTLVIIMHLMFIAGQILVLRKDYEPRQLLQIVVTLLFGFYTDITMWMTSFMQVPVSVPHAIAWTLQFVEMLAGGAILAFGIACEVRSDTLMLAPEGLSLAISRKFKKDFGKVKIVSDTLLVVIAIVLMLAYFHRWDWKMIGVGTLVSMFYVGFMVRVVAPHISWLDFIFIPKDERMAISKEEELARSEGKSVPFVITIAREYGSGGRELGRLLANRLGVGFYDRDIIDATAKELGYTQDFVRENEQNISTSKLWELVFTDKAIPISMNPSRDDAIFVSESRIIRSIAMKKPCVIIGRCANWALRNDSKALRIFVTSDKDDAIKRIMNRDGLSYENAEKRIEQVNTGRSNHYLQYTNHRWTDPHGYDLVINTSRLGLKQCADVIMEIYNQKGN